jgi:hypothetical protein
VIDPGPVSEILMLSAAPAFFLGSLIVEEFAWRGVSEVPPFMASMPPLIAGWFYWLGWLIDTPVRRGKQS